MLKLAVDNEFGDTDLVTAFCRHLLIREGLKSNTIFNHEKIVRRAIRIIGTQRPTPEQVEDYIAEMYQAKYSYAHMVNTIRMVSRYMKWLGSPVDIGFPKRPKRTLKDVLTEAEVAVIIAASKNIRERAILTLLAYSGIRNDELCNVRVRDVDFGGNMLHVDMGKGSKDRNIPISGECTSILLQYLADFQREKNDYLFTVLRSGGKYTPWALRLLVQTVVGRTNIKKRVYPHLFRHSLASNMIARGASVLTIQGQLGHAFVETTMIYIRSNDKRLVSEYNVYAPSYT